MMTRVSKLFYTDTYKAVQEKVKTILNAQEDYLTKENH